MVDLVRDAVGLCRFGLASSGSWVLPHPSISCGELEPIRCHLATKHSMSTLWR